MAQQRRRCKACGQFASLGHPCPKRNKTAAPVSGDYGLFTHKSLTSGPSLPHQQMGDYKDLYTSFQSHTFSPIEVSETADLVNADADQVYLVDYSPVGNGSTYTTLAAMKDPVNAGNNCYSVVDAVDRHIVEQVGIPEGWDPGKVELTFRDETTGEEGVHWANTLISHTGEEWVIDYTARQFDAKAAFPLVARRAAWQTWVSDRVRDQFNLRLAQAALY